MDLKKNPVSILNELLQLKKLTVQYSYGAQDIDKKFTCTIFANGGEWTSFGLAASKKTAQRIAAYKMLQILSTEDSFRDSIPKSCQFTDDDNDDAVDLNTATNNLMKLCEEKMYPEPVFSLISEYGPPHDKTFVMKCIISGLESIGKSSTKKMAKHLAAQKMLNNLDVMKVAETVREKRETNISFQYEIYMKIKDESRAKLIDYRRQYADIVNLFSEQYCDSRTAIESFMKTMDPSNITGDQFKILMDMFKLNHRLEFFTNKQGKLMGYVTVESEFPIICRKIGHPKELVVRDLYRQVYQLLEHFIRK